MPISPGRFEQEKYQRTRSEALLKRDVASVGTDYENKSNRGLKSFVASGSTGIEKLRTREVIFNTISFSLLCSESVNSKSVDEDEDGKSDNIKTLQRAHSVPETVTRSTCMSSSS